MNLSIKCVVRWLSAALLAAVASFSAGCSRSGNDAARLSLADNLAVRILDEAGAGGETQPALLITFDPETQPGPEPMWDSFPDAFTKAAGKKGWKIDAVEKIPYSGDMELTGQPITREAFLDLLKKHPAAGVVVTTVGVPKLAEADLAALGRSWPKVVIATGCHLAYLDALPAGAFKLAILPNDDMLSGNVPADSTSVDTYFRIIKK